MTLPIEDADYFIRFMQMPRGIYAFLMLNDDGTYSMYLDPRRDKEHQLDDYTHELWHILRDDIYDSRAVAEAEDEVQAM